MNTADKVKAMLATADLSTVRAPLMAEAIGLPCRRILESRLLSEGTCYAELLREERMSRCRALLKSNPHTDGHRLAVRCGYSTCFQAYVAFRRWFGVNWKDVKHVGLKDDQC